MNILNFLTKKYEGLFRMLATGGNVQNKDNEMFK